MSRRRVLTFWAIVVCGTPGFALADDFDQLEGRALAGVPGREGTRLQGRLTIAEIGQMPAVLRDTRSALIVTRTDQGNLARVLVVPALRKPPRGEGEAVPVLVLERFATFESGAATTRLARGQDLILFDGFRIDLDSGQVVPEGQGGDLQFLAGGQEGPRLVALADVTMFTLSRSPILAAESQAGPSPGRTVVPRDFAGRYRLYANGQWSGSLELKVDDQGALSGQFRSDLQGAIFPVSGQVALDVPQKATFTVTYPRARHDFEGYLWTDGKGAMAGTVAMLERTYGFFAIREGGRFAPEGVDFAPLAAQSTRTERRVVEVRSDGRYVLEGKPVDRAGLTAALKAIAEQQPKTWVLLRVPEDLPFAAVLRVSAAVQDARLTTIRFAPAHPEDAPPP